MYVTVNYLDSLDFGCTRLRVLNFALFTNYYLKLPTPPLETNKEPRVSSSFVESHIPQSHDTTVTSETEINLTCIKFFIFQLDEVVRVSIVLNRNFLLFSPYSLFYFYEYMKSILYIYTSKRVNQKKPKKVQI